MHPAGPPAAKHFMRPRPLQRFVRRHAPYLYVLLPSWLPGLATASFPASKDELQLRLLASIDLDRRIGLCRLLHRCTTPLASRSALLPSPPGSERRSMTYAPIVDRRAAIAPGRS